MTDPVVRSVLPPDWASIDPLIAESIREGFHLLERLRADYDSGANRFDRPGELLLGVFQGASLIAIGGLNRDPFTSEPGVGRIRRVFVTRQSRGQGVGSLLVRTLMAAATPHFHTVTLRAATRDAAHLYESLGFSRVTDRPDVTHVWTPTGA